MPPASSLPPESSPPDLIHGRPDWPIKDDRHLFWVGLRSDFRFSHHPAKFARKNADEKSYFCHPENLAEKLTGVMQHSGRGSVLVTGYRGTGKTSLVASCESTLKRRHSEAQVADRRELWWIEINLSTVSSGHEVLILIYEALVRKIETIFGGNSLRSRNSEIRKMQCSLSDETAELRSNRHTTVRRASVGLESPLASDSSGLPSGTERQHDFTRESLSRHQSKLADHIAKITSESAFMRSGKHPHLVFVFDELDKLQPSSQWRAEAAEKSPSAASRPGKLEQFQSIVSELKYFLTEAGSHQIFIAGKDADDSWDEDQNKGEGLFESIFVANIYVPSIFSTRLKPASAWPPFIDKMKATEDKKEATRSEFYALLAREIGIGKSSWAYNTTLLILPHLAEYEIYQLILRAYRRFSFPDPRSDDEKEAATVFGWLESCYEALGPLSTRFRATWRKPLSCSVRRKNFEEPLPSPEVLPKELVDTDDVALAQVMSDRTCRRLRILIEYLTYKGRGIPRKILREFYDMVQTANFIPESAPGYAKLKLSSDKNKQTRYVLALPQHNLQKMNFYAGIVEYLDTSVTELRGLSDKGRVSIYHIIDYVLKFYATGFSQRDIEHANFMTTREEFYPTRQLASLILRLLEGRLWRRKDSRNPEYRMVHHVVHDLSVMFLRYAPEQMELRHTSADFRRELEHLKATLAASETTPADQRLAPVHAQMRLARILDMTGHHFEARLAYFKALRWLRVDIQRFAEAGAKGDRVSQGFVDPFISYAMEALTAVGRLNEEMGEHRTAITHYEEARSFIRNAIGEADPKRQRAIPSGGGQNALLRTLIPSDADGRLRDEAWCDLHEIVSNRGVMAPLEIKPLSVRLADVLNHSAIAYCKMWENTSANLALLGALTYLHSSKDEYGMIDQLVLIAQVMLRRRDFHAAALWYLEALQHIKAIRRQSEKGSLQSGADWQTPPMATAIEAQILAALGDIYYATGGLALLGDDDVASARAIALLNRSATLTAKQKLSKSLKSAAVEKLKCIVQEIGVDEDRHEEYFHTSARFRFQSVGDHANATDVYLRQIEARLDRFQRTMTTLDVWKVGRDNKELRALKYTLLNAWSGFWQGARVLLHANLSAQPALTRDAEFEWGRIVDFRRMGVVLRLVGEMLREVALHNPMGASRRLLSRQTLQNNLETGHTESDGKTPRGLNPFYAMFVSDYAGPRPSRFEKPLTSSEVFAEANRRREELGWQIKEKPVPAKRPDILSKRTAVNRAARDIRTISAYLTDRADLLQDPYVGPLIADLETCGPRSPLFRLSSERQNQGPNAHPLLVAHMLRIVDPRSDAPPGPFASVSNLEEAKRDFRLLALAERSLITAYLCHRDTIPDYSYAHAAATTGGLYVSALYRLGGLLKARSAPPTKFPKEVADAIDRAVEYGKKFLVRAIDVLKREREQNRNTFHLMSEAWFNLGDLMLIRLSCLENPVSGPKEKRHPERPGLLDGAQLFGNLPPITRSGGENNTIDTEPEDVRRQVWDAYREGLLFVKSEIDEHSSRYRFPADVYHAHRNVMDSVLHFRICKAAQVRHGGGRYSPDEPFEAKTPGQLQRLGKEIADVLAHFESPQRPSAYWDPVMRRILSLVNRVRTDRGPLVNVGPDGKADAGEQTGVLAWASLDQLNNHTTLDLFNPLASQDS